MQLCPTYSKATPDHWYEKRIYDITARDDYDNTDKRQAAKIVEDFEHIATGLLYTKTDELDFMSLQTHRTDLSTTPVQEVQHVSV